MALVFNLHFGLAAWAAGPFSTGQCCSAGGQSYQCVVAGNSTAAPTGTGSSINNGGTAIFQWQSAIDLTTPQAFNAAFTGTLPQPVVLSVWNHGPITTAVGTQFIALSGHVTTPSNNITIQPAPGQGFATALSQANPNVLPSTDTSSAVVGTPGSLPTGDSYGGVGTLGTQVVGKGTTAQGLQYLDVRLFGTTSTTSGGVLIQTPATTPVTSASYVASAYVAVVGGSLSNVSSAVLEVDGYIDGSYANTPIYSTFTPTTTLARYQSSGAFTTTQAQFAIGLNFASGVAIDVTLRIAAPQLELGTLASAWRATPNAYAFNASNGASFVLPSSGIGNTNYFDFGDNNVVFQGLQVQDPNPTSGSTILRATQNCVVQNNIFDGYSQGGGAYMFNPTLGGASSSVFTFLNNLVVDRAAASVATSTISGNYNGTYANNTFVAINSPASLGCITDTSAATGVVLNQTNNVMVGYFAAGLVTQSQNASTAINVKYGLFSASTLSNASVHLGAGNVFSQAIASQFVASPTNFRLASTSPGISSGFTDTADIPSATDAIGASRPAGAWSMGALQFAAPSSAFAGGGRASGQFASLAGQTTFSGGGRASGQFVAYAGNVSAFSGGGQASGQFVSTGNTSSFAGGGQASGVFYNAQGSISEVITLSNPGTQVVGVPFVATGIVTLTPELEFADDDSNAFSLIPLSGVSPIGSATFAFEHPAISSPGEQSLLVEDLSTDASSAVHYAVTATPGALVSLSPGVGIGASLTSLSSIIPAYVYQQYADDQNIQAFAYAYNAIAQSYLDWFNGINLPIYTGSQITGALLDWVAAGIYGIQRPVLAAVQAGDLVGPFNTFTLSTIPYNSLTGTATSTVFPVTDDIFKRIITWSVYKGDGASFTVTWLKRRVARFLAGANGTDYRGPLTQVSVQFQAPDVINVTVIAGEIPLTVAPILQAAVLSGVLPLPFQYTFNVLINDAAPPPPPPPTNVGALQYNAANNSAYLALGF